MWFLALFTTVFSGIALALSVFPGPLELVPRTVFYVLGTILGLSAFAAAWQLFRPSRPGRPRQRFSASVVLLAAIVVPILFAASVPRRIVFQHYEPQFESMLADALPPGDHSIAPLNADLALYWVDQWGTDRRGGIYFRTLVNGERGGGVHRSFGFVHSPNSDGSPFGDSEYELQHLTGAWYSFAASDK